MKSSSIAPAYLVHPHHLVLRYRGYPNNVVAVSMVVKDERQQCGLWCRPQGDGEHGRDEERWLAQLQAADTALTAQLNSRDAALSARI